MTCNEFLYETQVYHLLESVGIKTPYYIPIQTKDDLEDSLFKTQQPIVLKGLAQNLWHKSDEGAVIFTHYEPSQTWQQIEELRQKVSKKYSWIEALLVERMTFKTLSQLPTELFISIKKDETCGWTLYMGFGGLQTESWNSHLKKSLLIWPQKLYSSQEAFLEFKEHLLGKIWLGELRQGEPLTTEKILIDYFQKLWTLTDLLEDKGIELLEINPVVLNLKGEPIALDGVGYYQSTCTVPWLLPHFEPNHLLKPQTLAMAGVSQKENSLGTRVLKNILAGHNYNGKITLIKPGLSSFLNVPCVPDVSHLKTHPVDIFILSLPAKQTLDTLRDLCEQGGGASIVYIVAGGLGDGGDQEGLGTKMHQLITERRRKGLWTPAIIGPNGMGMVNSPQKLNTVFISPDLLEIQFDPHSRIGIISQSGAFIATRISRLNDVSLKYGFSIGNQFDLRISDILHCLSEDDELQVIGLYCEGFKAEDAARTAKLIKQITSRGTHVVLYKGGRSQAGSAAAAGHTGSMAGNYDLEYRLFKKAGAIVTRYFSEFSTAIKWLSRFPKSPWHGTMAVISNAGCETVASADYLSETQAYRNITGYQLTSAEQNELIRILEKNKLLGLLTPRIPLDLTPMASEEVWLECIRFLAQTQTDYILLGIVPFTERLRPLQKVAAEKFAQEISLIAKTYHKAIGVAIDAGPKFNLYRSAFEKYGLPTFSSIDQAII